jgi:hypothetical protein
VYARSGRPLAITPKIRKALASDTADPRALAGQVTRLAASDPLLAVPPKVLIAVERARIGGRPRETLLQVVTETVQQHPGLACIDLAAATAAGPPVDHDGLLHAVKQALSQFDIADPGKTPLRPAERRALQDNAVLSRCGKPGARLVKGERVLAHCRAKSLVLSVESVILIRSGLEGFGDDDLDYVVRCGVAAFVQPEADGSSYYVGWRAVGTAFQVCVDGPGQAGDAHDQAGQRDRIQVLRRRCRGLPGGERGLHLCF